LSDFLFGEQRQFQDRLYLAHMPGEYLGTLYLDVDTCLRQALLAAPGLPCSTVSPAAWCSPASCWRCST
jgi:hypothetical protein